MRSRNRDEQSPRSTANALAVLMRQGTIGETKCDMKLDKITRSRE